MVNRPDPSCLCPEGESPMLTDVRAWSGNQIQASLLRSLQKRLDGQRRLVVKIATLALQSAPMQVKGHRVEAQGLDLLKDVEPQRGDGQSIRVELPREDHQALAIDEERVVVEGDDVLEQLSPLRVEQRAGPPTESRAIRLSSKSCEGEKARQPHCAGGIRQSLFVCCSRSLFAMD